MFLPRMSGPSSGNSSRAQKDEVCQGVTGPMLLASSKSYLGKFMLRACKSLLEVGPRALKPCTLHFDGPPEREQADTACRSVPQTLHRAHLPLQGGVPRAVGMWCPPCWSCARGDSDNTGGDTKHTSSLGAGSTPVRAKTSCSYFCTTEAIVVLQLLRPPTPSSPNTQYHCPASCSKPQVFRGDTPCPSLPDTQPAEAALYKPFCRRHLSFPQTTPVVTQICKCCVQSHFRSCLFLLPSVPRSSSEWHSCSDPQQ